MKKFVIIIIISMFSATALYLWYSNVYVPDRDKKASQDARFLEENRKEVEAAQKASDASYNFTGVELLVAAGSLTIKNVEPGVLANCQIRYGGFSGLISGKTIAQGASLDVERNMVNLTNTNGAEYPGPLNQSPDGKVSVLCRRGETTPLGWIDFSVQKS